MIGCVLMIFGVWLAYTFRFDQAEGLVMRPVGCLIAVVGVFRYLEGMKHDIIDAIVKNLSVSKSNV